MSIELRNEVRRLGQVTEAQGIEIAAQAKRLETLEALVTELSKAVQVIADSQALASIPDEEAPGKNGGRAKRG